MPLRLVPPRDRKLYRLLKAAESRTVTKGTVLYEPGEAGSRVYFVREGYVRLTLPGLDPGSGDRTVSLALPWELCGDDALISGTRWYGASAGCRCTVQPLPATPVLDALKTARRSLSAYLEGVERELHRLRHAQGGSNGPTAAQRLAEVLLDLSERCGEPWEGGVGLSQRLTHQVLADLAGSHRATVTTLLNDWLYEEILDTDAKGRLVLARVEELRARTGRSSRGGDAVQASAAH